MSVDVSDRIIICIYEIMMDELEVQEAKFVPVWIFFGEKTLTRHIICLCSLLLSKTMNSLTEQE